MKAAFVVGLSVLILAVNASPEPEANPEAKPAPEATAEPARYSQPAPTYSKPSYPKPAYPKEEPYKQSAYPKVCDPRTPPKCAKSEDATVCLKDEEYPEREIEYAIQYDLLVLKKYAEIAQQSADNLVDGLTSLSENHFDYYLYNGNTFEKGNWVGGEGYICPSDVKYSRPVRAKNVDGEWRVIVQDVAYYTQTQRSETCLFAGASCRTLAPCYRSVCVQKYVYQRMLSFDPCDVHRGLFVDIYKLPSACSCNLPAILH